MKHASKGNSSAVDLIDLIRWDPALSIRLMAAANGTKAGQARPCLSLPRAVGILKDFTFRLLSLQFTLDSLAPENEPYRAFYETYWRQCRIHAITAELLSPNETENAEADPFLAGLLLTLDRLSLLQTNPERFASLQNAVIQSARPWNEVKRTTTQDQAEHPLRLANVPPAIMQALKAHQARFPQSNNSCSHWERLFAVAEAMGEFLVYGEIVPDRAAQWHDRLMGQYEGYRGDNAGTVGTLESLIDSVRARLRESLPPEEPLAAPAKMLTEANRALGRLGWETRSALRRAKLRIRKAEQSLEQSRRTIRNLKRQALRDPLTGAYNRRFLWEALHKEAARCRRHAAPIGLLFVDVDDFKTLNDTWGHLVGDLVLCRVAETLSGTLRQADILARYGGEEFIVLPVDPTESGLVQLAERLREAVERLEIQVEGTRIPVTVSVGCTLAVPGRNEMDSASLLLASADAAMYDAKGMGRNRVVFRSMIAESERALIQRTIDCSFSRWLLARKVVTAEAIEELLSVYAPARLPSKESAVETGASSGEQWKAASNDNGGTDDPLGSISPQENLPDGKHEAMRLAWQRENPFHFARLLIAKNILNETQARELVKQYLSGL